MSNEEAMFTISDVTVDHSAISKAELFKAWTWLVPERLEPLFITVFGDAFLIDPTSSEVLFLDTVDGDLESIADSLEEFSALLASEDNEFVRDYFSIAPWLLHKDEILDGQEMPEGMVFNYLTPFALGGEPELENIALFPLQDHFDMSGEFWERMQQLEEAVAKELEAAGDDDLFEASEELAKPDNPTKH